MEIKSKAFTDQQINSDTIISFPKGIPGFEDHTQFQLFHQEDNTIVFLLQSTTDENIAFSVAHPSNFNINYQFLLTDEEVSTLDMQPTDELLILLILHKDKNSNEPNLPTVKGSIKSPLLINIEKRIGIQKTMTRVEQSITYTEKNNEIEVTETK
ncbi:MAG: flagellar assembly protein FliW [Methylococcaceae bacterium]|nr:flagellar assembly protein FliW [Methylococcaceae bacterium]